MIVVAEEERQVEHVHDRHEAAHGAGGAGVDVDLAELGELDQLAFARAELAAAEDLDLDGAAGEALEGFLEADREHGSYRVLPAVRLLRCACYEVSTASAATTVTAVSIPNAPTASPTPSVSR